MKNLSREAPPQEEIYKARTEAKAEREKAKAKKMELLVERRKQAEAEKERERRKQAEEWNEERKLLIKLQEEWRISELNLGWSPPTGAGNV